VKHLRTLASLGAAVLLLIACVWGIGLVMSEVVEWTRPRPVHPTYEKLTERGFYVLVLPESEVSERAWKQEVSIYSWDAHCGVLPGDTYNPLTVTYEDVSRSCTFKIQVGLWSIVWDRSQATERNEFFVDSWLNKDGLVIHCGREAEDNFWRNLYHFSDMQGFGVDIQSSLSVSETLDLIEYLEYVGPPLETLGNPWDRRD
jgi:hypothetical protein